MAELSNQLMVITVLAYLAAMVCHAAEYAFGERSLVGRAATRPATQLVGAGAPTDLQRIDPVRSSGAASRPGWASWAGHAAVAVFASGVLAHLGTLVTRSIAADRMPWGNMYEFTLSVAFVGAVTWIGVLRRRPSIRHLGLFVTLVLVVLLGANGLIAYTPVGPLVPALNSYWFIIHVSTVILSSGVFLLGVVPATAFLVRSGYDHGKRRFPTPLGPAYRLPVDSSVSPSGCTHSPFHCSRSER